MPSPSLSRRAARGLLLAGLAVFAPGLVAQGQGAEIWRAEVSRLASHMADLLADGDTAGFDRCFCVDRLMASALHGLDLGAAAEQALRVGFRKTFSPGRRLRRATRRGSFTFVRLRGERDELRAVFRIVGDRGALNYHEMIFAPQLGRPTVVDFFNFQAGERHSATIRRLILVSGGAVREAQDGDLLAQLGALHRVFGAGRLTDAAILIDALPAAVRRQKTYLAMRIQCAAQQGRQAHLQALGEYSRAVPEADPSRALVLMDLFLLRGQFGRAIAAIDQLAARLGGDPYLRVIRARLLVRLDRLDEARREAEAATAAAPNLAQSYTALLSVCLLQSDHRRSAGVLDALDQRFTLRTGGLRGLRGFDQFLASAVGRRWREDFDTRHMKSGWD